MNTKPKPTFKTKLVDGVHYVEGRVVSEHTFHATRAFNYRTEERRRKLASGWLRPWNKVRLQEVIDRIAKERSGYKAIEAIKYPIYSPDPAEQQTETQRLYNEAVERCKSRFPNNVLNYGGEYAIPTRNPFGLNDKPDPFLG